MTDDKNSENKYQSPQELYTLLLRCSHNLSRGHHRGMLIQPGQQRVLSLLAAREKIGQRELADVLQIRPASLSELLTKLEGKGLVTRTRADAARRGVEVEITHMGKKAAEVSEGDGESVRGMFSVLSEEERQRLAQLLDKLLGAWRDADCCGRGPGFHSHGHFGGRGHDRGASFHGGVHGHRPCHGTEKDEE